jgi:hypothetical protein
MNPIDALSVLVWRAVISVPPLLEVDCLSQIVIAVSRSFYE